MKSKIAILLGIVMMIALSLAYAQNVQEAILVTMQNYPDAAVADVIAQKYGIPVIVIDGFKLLSEDEIKNLTSQGIKKIYIIGGPAVISTQVEKQLSQYFEVKRIFGMTKYGTSIEVAKYFFADANTSIIVSDYGDYPPEKGKIKLVTLASKLSAKYGLPLLINPPDELSATTENYLINYGIKQVILVGNFSENVTKRLNELGIKIIKHIAKRDEDKEVNEEIERKAKELNEKIPLLIICKRNFNDTLGIVWESGHVMFVSNVSDVNVSFIREKNFTRIKVLGYPTCAEEVYNYLTQLGFKVETVSGGADKVTREKLKEMINKSAEIREKLRDKLENIIAKKIKRENMKKEAEDVKQLYGLLRANLTDCLREKLNITEISSYISEINSSLYQLPDETLRQRIRDLWDRLEYIKTKIRNAIWECRREIETLKEEVFEKESLSKREIIKKEIEKIGGRELVERIIISRYAAKCAEDLSDAWKKYKEQLAEGVACAMVISRYECPYDSKFVVAVPNACVASILEERGWKKVEESSIKPFETVAERAKETSLTAEIVITDSGFQPEKLVVKKGTRVIFINQASREVWPASDYHPTHRLYPGSGIEKCGTPEEKNIFDACRGLKPGESWSFVFNEVGTWTYHDHLAPRFKGTIIVTE
ncbi:MAG: cell wall-binding repeat-containing protein [Candidatus Aenigmatarchaeota archaeon]